MNPCVLCAPAGDEYRFPIASLEVSTLYLKRDQRYRGACVLVYSARHAAGLDALSSDEAVAAMRDLHRAAQAVVATVKPDHMNYMSLGNVVPHLHWHLVPRYRTDGRWGQAIGSDSEIRLTDAECETLVRALREAVASPTELR